MTEELLSVREVARRCHRSEETVRRWIWSGKLRAQKLGNQLFVRPDALADVETPSQSAGKKKPGERDSSDWLKSSRRLRERLFKKYGYFDVAELVRQSREDH